MNIVLIGYRGAGKSVVGELVAKRLQMKCIAMDAIIVEMVALCNSAPYIIIRDFLLIKIIILPYFS